MATSITVTCRPNTHQRSPAYGRTCKDQPNGESQDSTPFPASPTARRANAAPRTANEIPRAVRAEADNCAATAATAAKTRPEAASAAPKATEPAGGTSAPSRPTVPISPVSIEAPNARMSAAVSPA